MSDEDKDARAAFAKFKSQLRKAARTDPRITPKARNLVDAILDEIWSTEGYCGKPFEKLQHEIGAKCRRTVQRAAFDLERFGYFVVERSSGGGSKKTNHFRMPLSIPDATENVTLDQPGDVTLNVTLECHGQCDIPTAGSVTPPPRAVRHPDHPDTLKYSFKNSHHHAAARVRAREDGAVAPAAAEDDDDDFRLKGSQMLDELRRGLRTGEVSLGDVEDVLAEYRAEEPEVVSFNAEIVRRLEAGEELLDVRSTIELGLPVATKMIRHPANDEPAPPPSDRLAALRRSIVEGDHSHDAREAIIDGEVEMSGRENAELERIHADKLAELDRYNAWMDDALEADELVPLKLPVIMWQYVDGDPKPRPVVVPDKFRMLLARIPRTELPTAA